MAERVDLLRKQLNEWLRSLGTLQQLMTDEASSPAVILQQVGSLQSQFQSIVSAIDAAELSPAVEQALRPYQTEAHRRLRLLSVESMKLRTARAPETVAQVRSRLKAHLDQLQQFASAIANEL